MHRNKTQLSKPLQAWMDRGQFLHLNGHQIFVIDEGDKNLPVILLIHGFPTSSWDFEAIWNSLNEDYRVICLDLLGFGFSDKPNKPNYTIHRQADLVETVVNHLRIKQFHILAHDYGVTVAQELLARQLDGNAVGNCLSCCFLNGGLFPETHRPLMIQRLMLSPAGKVINYFVNFKTFSGSFRKIFASEHKPNQTQLEQFWQIINFKDGKHLFHNLITYILDRRKYRDRWITALQKSSIPLALINGSEDPISGAHLVERYKELECRLDYLAQLNKVGHYPQIEVPQKVSMHYLTFLNQ